MKKNNLIETIVALTEITASTAADYSENLLSIKMKPYNKKYKFTGDKVIITDEFETESLAASFGGLAIDFRNATLKDNLGTLKIFAHFSGIDIIVPDNWVVKTIGTVKNAGVSNQAEEETTDNQPTLIVKHDLHFAGLSIRRASLTQEIKDDIKEQAEDVLENAESFVEELND